MARLGQWAIALVGENVSHGASSRCKMSDGYRT